MSDYFGEQIAQGKPIIPPTPAQAPPVVPQPAGVVPPPTFQQGPSEFVGLPVRAVGDRVFLLKSGRKHWITSPEALNSLGFQLGDESRIDQATLDVIPEGEPIR